MVEIYHGSDVYVEKPRIFSSNRLLDFGMGFYTTSNKKQAVRWAEKVSKRNNTNQKFLSIYNFNLEMARKELDIVEFSSANENWFNFITANRRGADVSHKYDIAIGPVADDNEYQTIKLFETGVLNKEDAIKRLKAEKLFNQILFHTERALKYCVFDKYINLGVDTNG